MLPISWPVSLVLALFMTAFHVIHTIIMNEFSPDINMVCIYLKVGFNSNIFSAFHLIMLL